MSGVEVKGHFDGLDRLARDVELRERALVGAVSRSLFAIASDGARRMREAMTAAGSPSAPGGAPGIVTGNLIKSVRVTQLQGDLEAHLRFGTKGGKRGGAPHWHLLEFGTRKMAARPVLRPAGAAAAAEGERKLAEAMGRVRIGGE